MYLKSILWAGVLWACVSTAGAQSAREEIKTDVRLSASNYCAYREPQGVRLTPALSGYEPFYLSAYARHGSRFQINPNEYREPLRVLQQADSVGALTPLGQQVLAVVDSVARMANGRYGELTPLGARQHRGIAARMYARFPQVFEGRADINARSTPVVRCILSMLNECCTLQGLNPQLQVTTDASAHDMYYMNDEFNRVTRYRGEKAAQASLRDFRSRQVKPDRLMRSLFADTAYVSRHVKAGRLMGQLFDLASNMQSLDTSLDLYNLFTTDECYDLWLRDNYDWYVNYGPSPLTQGKLPYTQANLLRNILDTADTCVARRQNGATLRFGHEVCVLPLACLMELDSCGYATTCADSVAMSWRNYRIFPMASNIQMVFYRNKQNDILVKVLLNEREVRLPVPTRWAPYYKWTDVRAYYRQKLAQAD